ncbi:MAG: response regulator [Candidatus Omnitrophota bacterium]|jgi:CheY-like chemotaxis protein
MHKILVVDDEAKIVSILSQYLEHKGFEVEKAYGGEEALDKIKSVPSIDLIILDKKMPGIDGVDVMRELKKTESKIPVILITGSIGRSQLNLPKDLLFEDLLFKPVRLSELVDAINCALSSKKPKKKAPAQVIKETKKGRKK